MQYMLIKLAMHQLLYFTQLKNQIIYQAVTIYYCEMTRRYNVTCIERSDELIAFNSEFYFYSLYIYTLDK